MLLNSLPCGLSAHIHKAANAPIRVQRPAGHSSAEHYPSNKHTHRHKNALDERALARGVEANRTAEPHTDLYDLIKLSALPSGSKERWLFSGARWKRSDARAPAPSEQQGEADSLILAPLSGIVWKRVTVANGPLLQTRPPPSRRNTTAFQNRLVWLLNDLDVARLGGTHK